MGGESRWKEVKVGGQECPLYTMGAINKSVGELCSAGQPGAAVPA